MRLRKRDLCTVYLKKRIVADDEESNNIVTYSDKVIKLDMTVQDAGGAVLASLYGEKLQHMKSCMYQGDDIREGENELDGVCLYVCKENDPDYEIKKISTFSTHLNITLEKRNKNGCTD